MEVERCEYPYLRYGDVEMEEINYVEFSTNNGFRFLNSKHEVQRDDEILNFKFRKQIITGLTETLNFLNEEFSKRENIVDKIKKIGGDYLILANLSEVKDE